MKSGILLGIALAAVLLACPKPLIALSPAVVGLPVPLSGNWAELGTAVKKGAELARSEINAAGGFLGRTVEFDVQDTDESVSPGKLLTAYRFQRSSGISLFIGPTGTPGGLALAPLAARDDVLMISPGVGISHAFHTPRGNTCNIQGGWEAASRALAGLAVATGETKMALFSSQHPFDTKQGDEFTKAFIEKGGRITARVSPAPEMPDLLPYVTALLKSAPQAVFISNYNQLGLAARQLRGRGFKGRIFTVQVDESRLETAQGALEGCVFGQLSKISREFREKFLRAYGEEPRYLADYAYDATMILAEAVRKAGSLRPSELTSALRNLKWQGASGSFHLDDGCEAVRTPFLFTIESGAPVEILKSAW